MKFLLLAFLFVTSICSTSPAQSVFEKQGNIFFTDSTGSVVQLTFSGQDSNPLLSSDQSLIAFVHSGHGRAISTGTGDYEPSELWLYDLVHKKTEQVLASKSARRMEDVIATFTNIQFSNDSKAIYFLTDAWTTSAAVHRVDLQSRRQTYIAPGNSLEVIREGKFKGDLKVRQHRYHKERGSYDCDYILSPEGKEIAVIPDSCDK